MLINHYCLATRPCECFARVWGSEKKKQKDSLVNLAEAIIDPYNRDMKSECEKDKFVWNKAWVNELDEEHIKYAAKDAYTSYEMYRRIVYMMKCLLPANGEER
ncbi:putative ubiquitin-conjugating enzyme E2 26 [Hordeum vulgare]|nr:putative ubiquitin-conjugating enzyme E2 26 [Hordeum vulgare]